MKITKDTQTVWKLENGHTIIGVARIEFGTDYYFVKKPDSISIFRKDEMIEVYGLTEDQFANIEKSGI